MAPAWSPSSTPARWARAPAARFVGAYDTRQPAAKALAARLRGKAYPTLAALLADAEVDAVHVLTPPEGHLEVTLAAGKHVLVEKPVSHAAEDLRRIMRAATRADRVCMPAHNYIYTPSLQQARRLIDEGKLGKVAAFWMMYNLFHDRNLVRKYGSIYRVVCVHHAYSLLYLLGRPESVSSVGVRGVHAPGVDHIAQASITCQMPDGALANLWASFAAKDPTSDPWQVLYKVLGTKGGISYSWNEASYEDAGGPGFGLPGYVDAFRNEVAYFIDQCIVAGAEPLSTMQDALDALRIVEAAEQSAARGRRVTLKWPVR